MAAIITLTTDFGIQDTYVAAMKGVILDINPKVTLLDICHSIEPQNIPQAAFLISTAYGYFPQGTIHMVIVDPEVGSQRRAIILKTRRACFLAPDNGVLSYIIHRPWPKRGLSKAEPTGLPPGLQAIEISNPKFWHHPVSSTFHGRDIFAPVAAHLSLGVPLQEFGPPITSLKAFPLPKPQLGARGELIGHILHIDRFGNIITDIDREDLPSAKFSIEIAARQIESLSPSYAEADGLLALIGSSGQLEIAVKNSSAAALLGAKIGDEVRIRKEE
jgi:S-adenosylmethionine hydrolase